MENKRGRPPKKDYDAEQLYQTLLSAVTEIYAEKGEIKATALELDMTPLKIKKLLISAGKLHYPQTADIQALQKEGKSLEEIQTILCLSRASINSYLPYTKKPYKGELSQNAERVKQYQLRKAAVSSLQQEPTEENLWNCIVAFQNYPFFTATGLPFTYTLKKGKKRGYNKVLVIDRRENSKTLTWSSLWLAFTKATEMGECIVTRPKQIGDIRSISYIYPLLWRFGIIQVPDKTAEKMRGHQPHKYKKAAPEDDA